MKSFAEGVTICNAVITAATLRQERGFVLDSWVTVDYGGSAQGFGGFALYISRDGSHHHVQSPAGHWFWRVMEIAGVEDWSQVVGKAIRCRIEGGRIVAIGHMALSEVAQHENVSIATVVRDAVLYYHRAIQRERRPEAAGAGRTGT